MKGAHLAIAAVAASLLAVGYTQSPSSSTPAAPSTSNSDPAPANVFGALAGANSSASGTAGVAAVPSYPNPASAAPAYGLGHQAPQPAAPAYGQGDTSAAPQPAAAPAVNPYAQPASDPAAVAAPGTPAIVPSVVYALDQVDPTTFATITTIDLSHGAPVLHTGDVFAILYSTNLPGQVRIDNDDSAGATNPLGTYTVVPGRDNRIPVTKGVQLTGVTGTEQFKMYFYPCAAADPSGGSGNAAAATGLPPYSAAASPKLAMASKRLVVAKSATNLESPDPTIAVAAAANYRPNDVTENDFSMQHMPRQ